MSWASQFYPTLRLHNSVILWKNLKISLRKHSLRMQATTDVVYEIPESARDNFGEFIHQFQPETKTKLKRIFKKLYRKSVSLLFNQTWLNERLLPNYSPSLSLTHIHTHTHWYTHAYLYVCVCVCVCICVHTHTDIYIYIYIERERERELYMEWRGEKYIT